MGKYTEERIRGYILYFTMKCLAEGIIHVHANKSSMTENSIAKLWVYEDGTTQLAKPSEINPQDLKAIQDWIYLNIDVIKEKWLEKDATGSWKEK